MNTKVTSSRDQKFCIDWDGSAFARTSIKQLQGEHYWLSIQFFYPATKARGVFKVNVERLHYRGRLPIHILTFICVYLFHSHSYILFTKFYSRARNSREVARASSSRIFLAANKVVWKKRTSGDKVWSRKFISYRVPVYLSRE